MRRISFPVLVLICSLYLFTSCQDKAHSNHQYADDEPIDSLMENSFESVAKALLHSDRMAWQKPDEVLDRMGNLSNKTVADIGAGTGFFSFLLAQRAKKVLAIDIDTMALIFIDSSMQQYDSAVQARIETRLAKSDNPAIGRNEVDVVLMVNTYSFIRNRVSYFRNLHSLIKHGGQLLVVDFKKKKLPLGPPSSLKIPLSTVEYELEQAGFTLKNSDDRLLDYQYLVHATKK